MNEEKKNEKKTFDQYSGIRSPHQFSVILLSG